MPCGDKVCLAPTLPRPSGIRRGRGSTTRVASPSGFGRCRSWTVTASACRLPQDGVLLIARVGSTRHAVSVRAGNLFAARTLRSMTSESRRSSRGAVPCRHTCGVSPLGASISMTRLAAPAVIIATATYPTEPATSAACGSQPVDDPGRAALGIPAAPALVDPRCIADTWPLYASDPVRVDGYRLVSRLGDGGMADVFYAEAPTGGAVAVKILRAAGGGSEACLREFEMASAMDAACTAPALGHGMSTAGAYLVTAYLPGYRCGTTLEGRSPPAGQLWAFGSALARVLAAVHARGVVHCDVKPSNLLVRGRDVRLIDFGIARYVGERCSSDGMVECTRGWAAPEQLRGDAATPAVDVFAWGCLLAYLVGGVHPFASVSDQEWILRVQSAEPDLSGVPSGLAEVIRWALARNPRDRPSAPELITIWRARGNGHPGPAPRLQRDATTAQRCPVHRRRGAPDDPPADTQPAVVAVEMSHHLDTTVTPR